MIFAWESPVEDPKNNDKKARKLGVSFFGI